MELAREDNRRHRRDRETERQRRARHAQQDVVTEEMDRLTENVAELATSNNVDSVKEKLFEQEGAALNEKVKVESLKNESKEKVARLFETLRNILSEKETELLESIDIEYDKSLDQIDKVISGIVSENVRLQNLCDPGCIDSEEEVINQIEHNLADREDALKNFCVPNVNIKDDSIQALKNLSFGEVMLDNSTASNADGTDNVNGASGIGTESGLGADDTSGTAFGENSVNDEGFGYDNRFSESSYNESEQRTSFSASETSVDGDTQGVLGYTTQTNEGVEINETSQVMPSAPALPQEEEPPPSYWQAIGEQAPAPMPMQPAAPHPTVQAPAYDDITHNNRLPQNSIDLWHAFPVRRQYDRKGPLVIAMTWNHGRICITDRANNKVKFYYPNGTLVKEMQFLGYELYDITYLEEVAGDVRYLLACPKNKILMILSIDHNNTARCVNKIVTQYFYTNVCRGPEEQTLVGTEVLPKAQQFRQPAVHVFRFSGEILVNIAHTPSFVPLAYPKALEVYHSSIIVLDWKLSSVCVYRKDSTPVAEYRGTPEHPLRHPLHMTLDSKGNIMILNGDSSDIHVIDLHCNPLEVIKIPHISAGTSTANGPKLIAFDKESCRLSIARGNGEIAVFAFHNGYDSLSQRNLPPRNVFTEPVQVAQHPATLPLVEGMCPSTIEGIITRPTGRNRSRQFHL